MTDHLPRYQPANRADWRTWLRANHAKSTGVWMVFLKGKDRQLSYDDAVEEALCFGWIDSLTKSLDERAYLQLFTPRKPKSAWASSNKKRVERLIKRKLMTRAGLAKIEAAKKDGSWTKLDAIEAMTVPADLAKALARRKKARAFFDSLAPSTRKAIMYWVTGVKNPDLRAERVAHTVSQAGRGLRPEPIERWLEKSRGKRR